MIDLGLSKIALIGVVALVVIGPEKLPQVARTVGALIGRAQRYVADVKAEVGRSIELEDLKKMKDAVQTTARDVQTSMQDGANEFEKSWSEATEGLDNSSYLDSPLNGGSHSPPVYKHPKKNWRIKQKAIPQWYKSKTGLKTHTQSAAARVARFRPRASTRPLP